MLISQGWARRHHVTSSNLSNLNMTSDGKILEQPVPAPEDNVKPLNYREQFSVCYFVVFASVDV